MSRRIFLIETLHLHQFLTFFTSSLRLSSVNAGTEIRMTSPSLVGLTPKFAAMIAFSISSTEVLSYGEITNKRASGTLILANCCTGVGAP